MLLAAFSPALLTARGGYAADESAPLPQNKAPFPAQLAQAGQGPNGLFLAAIGPPLSDSHPIATVADLMAINEHLDWNYHLVADIDLGGIEWAPIGYDAVQRRLREEWEASGTEDSLLGDPDYVPGDGESDGSGDGTDAADAAAPGVVVGYADDTGDGTGDPGGDDGSGDGLYTGDGDGTGDGIEGSEDN